MNRKHTFLFLALGYFHALFAAEEAGPPKLEKPETQLAFVLLSEARLPTEEALLASFEKLSGPEEELTISEDEPEAKPKEDEHPMLVVDLKGVGTAFIALIDAPIPKGEAEAHFEYSLSSYADGAKLGKQRAHLMISLFGIQEACTPTEAMMGFTSLLAAVVDASPSSGVYWGNVGATHRADFFVSIASEYSVNPRILLWTGLSRAGEPDGKMSFLSLGMNQLALPDLYLVCKQEEAGEALPRLFDLLAYIAERGEAIPEGDTIGSSDEERIPVRYVPSPAEDGSTVWRVEL